MGHWLGSLESQPSPSLDDNGLTPQLWKVCNRLRDRRVEPALGLDVRGEPSRARRLELGELFAAINVRLQRRVT